MARLFPSWARVVQDVRRREVHPRLRLAVRRVILFPAGDPDPAETVRCDVELVARWDADVVGVAGWSEHGWDAVQLAGAHPEIERLVLLATPIDEERAVPEIAAKTLLLFGVKDERTGSRAARWWKEQIPHARIEMSPVLGHDLLADRWSRALSHLAPGTLR